MAQFQPRDVSRDVSNMFCKFAQGVAESQKRFTPEMPTSAPRPFMTKNGAGNAPSMNLTPTTDPEEFISRWNLGFDAQAILTSLQPEVAEKVMREFNPRDTTSDANNI